MIEAKDINFSYSRREKALDNFTLDVEAGCAMALLGPNGAGKTTAMYCLLNLIKPQSGIIKIDGRLVSGDINIKRQMCFLPEEPHYPDFLTVFELIQYYTAFYKPKIGKPDILPVIDQLDLGQYAGKRLSKCSKGTRQKAGLAVCMLSGAKYLFMDEPTSGLDPLIIKQFRSLIGQLNQNGATILINSHIISEIEKTCTHAAFIKNGKILLTGSLVELVGKASDCATIEDLYEKVIN